MSQERTLAEQIGTVERKLEIRRERTLRHLREARDEMQSGIDSGKKWAPLVLVGALGATAFAVGRRHSGNGDSDGVRGGTRRRTSGALATAAAVAGTVARVALTPQARDLWRAWRSSRVGLGRG